VGSIDRRLENLERLVEGRVEARVREELEAALDRLERHMTREEVIRVARILADEEEPQEGGGRWPA
jgi:hypothetical protein